MTEYGYDAKDEALGKLYNCLAKNLRKWEDEEDSVQAEHRDLIRETRDLLEQVKTDIPNILNPEPVWAGAPDPVDPDNYWIDDATGERVNAATGERSAVQ